MNEVGKSSKGFMVVLLLILLVVVVFFFARRAETPVQVLEPAIQEAAPVDEQVLEDESETQQDKQEVTLDDAIQL